MSSLVWLYCNSKPLKGHGNEKPNWKIRRAIHQIPVELAHKVSKVAHIDSEKIDQSPARSEYDEVKQVRACQYGEEYCGRRFLRLSVQKYDQCHNVSDNAQGKDKRGSYRPYHLGRIWSPTYKETLQIGQYGYVYKHINDLNLCNNTVTVIVIF